MSADGEITTDSIVTMRERIRHVAISAADVEAGWSSDETLMRFLRARKYNVDLAVNMYEKTLAFRAAQGLDRMLENFVEPRVLRHYFAEGFTGVDRQGFPVLVERIGTSTCGGRSGWLANAETIACILIYANSFCSGFCGPFDSCRFRAVLAVGLLLPRTAGASDAAD